ncbi:MAG: gamma-glutamyltransferase [Pseudomonadales bacterium]
MRGAVAAGHPVTAAAAEEILHQGGNAFDAIVAAHFAACVAEPVLATLAGGGYMLGQQAGQQPVLYDFFAQTPGSRETSKPLDFYPIYADFGTVRQEFHIGLGSVAVPGSVKGMFTIHRDLCSLPMTQLVEPAVRAASKGVVLNHLQASIFHIVRPIYEATAAVRANYSSLANDDRLVEEGDVLVQPELAAAIEAIGREGDRLFYEGEMAAGIADLCQQSGGYLSRTDLRQYKVIQRQPLQVRYRDVVLHTNPPPSSGGILIAFALDMLEQFALKKIEYGSLEYLQLLATVMEQTNAARLDYLAEQVRGEATHLLDQNYLEKYRAQVAGRARCQRGTSHISVVDSAGNTAAMTVSNGEGCGHLLPGTGIMLNNILGEEDLNPNGFHQWQPNQRMTSMMSPALLQLPNGTIVALGSGGSNRIRTAILQVVLNLVDFDMSPEQAVVAARIHCEAGHLNIEPGFARETVAMLQQEFPDNECWASLNLFFGGVHTVEWDGGKFHGVGDPRRGGVGLVVEE